MNIAHQTDTIIQFDKNKTITKVIDNSQQTLHFNVMPNKFVEETLIIDKYIISDNKIEAYFDRLYKTDMKKSPNHFIFLSSLINIQKMIYLYMCKKFDIAYNPTSDEKFKIWPIRTDIQMNGMVRDSLNVMQDFKIEELKKINSSKYYINGSSSTKSIIKITGSAYVYVI